MKNYPCFHCEMRVVGCHSLCKEYLCCAEEDRLRNNDKIAKRPIFDYCRQEKRKQIRRKNIK